MLLKCHFFSPAAAAVADSFDSWTASPVPVKVENEANTPLSDRFRTFFGHPASRILVTRRLVVRKGCETLSSAECSLFSLLAI